MSARSIFSTCAARRLKSAVMSPSSAKERREVAEQVDAGDPPQRGQQRCRAPAEHPHPEAGRAHERLQRPALEERGQPSGGVEEVERVARRRRVEHQQVELVLLVELVELGDRGELLRAGDSGRELAVDAVGLDLLAPAPDPARSARSARRTSASGRASSPTARPRSSDRAPASRSGATRRGSLLQLLEAERVRQPLRRVDRHHRDLGARAPPSPARSRPTWSSCRRRLTRRTRTRACLRAARRRRRSQQLSSEARRPASSSSRGTELLGEHVGQLDQRRAELRRASRAPLLALAAARACSDSAARSAARASVRAGPPRAPPPARRPRASSNRSG